MSDDEAAIEENEQSLSIPYFLFIFVIGVGIVGIIAFGGGSHWPLIPTLLIGAAAQTVFRVVKTSWSNALAGEHASVEDDGRFLSVEFIKNIALIYAVMIVVSAFWYGIGWGVNWLWNMIF